MNKNTITDIAVKLQMKDQVEAFVRERNIQLSYKSDSCLDKKYFYIRKGYINLKFTLLCPENTEQKNPVSYSFSIRCNEELGRSLKKFKECAYKYKDDIYYDEKNYITGTGMTVYDNSIENIYIPYSEGTKSDGKKVIIMLLADKDMKNFRIDSVSKKSFIDGIGESYMTKEDMKKMNSDLNSIKKKIKTFLQTAETC